MLQQELEIPFLHIDRKQGLPSSQIHSLAADDAGNIWFATPAGVCRFDGVNVHVYTQNEGLGTHGIRCVEKDTSGIIVGTDIGIDMLVDQHSLSKSFSQDVIFTRLDLQGSILSGFIETITCDEKYYWLGSSKGLYVVSKAKPENGAQLVFPGFIEKIIQLNNNKKYVLGRHFTIREVDAELNWVDVECSLISPDYVSAISKNGNNDNELIFACSEGLYVLNKKDVSERKMLLNLPNVEITCFVFFAHELWLGTTEGLYYYNFLLNTEQHILCVNTHFINDIYIDKDKNVWVATNDACLFKYSAMREFINQYAVNSVFSIRRSYHLSNAHGGVYQLATLRGVKTLCTLEGINEYPNLSSFSGYCWDIIEFQNKLLIATSEGLLVSGFSGEIERLGRHNVIAMAPNRIFYRNEEGVYLGTQTGMVLIDKNFNLHIQTVKDDKHFGYVYTIEQDMEGNLWVGTIGNGLWKGTKVTDNTTEKKYHFEQYLAGEFKQESNIYCVRNHKSSQLAILQDNQLLIIGLNQIPTLIYTSSHPIMGWSAEWESESCLWVGSSNGLYEVLVPEGRILREIKTIPGSKVWEFNSSRSLYLDKSKRIKILDHASSPMDTETDYLMCAIRGSVVRIDLKKLRNLVLKPEVEFSDCVWINASVGESARKVKTGKWSLKVNLNTQWTLDTESLQIRTRLIGFDESWSQFGPLSSIYYNSLPVGNYSLEVQASSQIAGIGRVVNVFDFQVVSTNLFAKMFNSIIDALFTFKSSIKKYIKHKELLQKESTTEEIVESKMEAFVLQTIELNRRNEELTTESRMDSLTNVPNRFYLDEALKQHYQDTLTEQKKITLLFMDVDNFKQYNDGYGHQAGDQVLKKIAALIVDEMRLGSDFFGRYGGEEFMAILPGADLVSGEQFSQRIHATLLRENIPHIYSESGTKAITLSIGGICFDAKLTPNASLKSVIEQADKNLYIAKRSGKEQSVFGTYQ